MAWIVRVNPRICSDNRGDVPCFSGRKRQKTADFDFFGGGLGKTVASDEEWFEEKASKAKSAIAHVIDTHVHVDR
jgi:hypothetical protein